MQRLSMDTCPACETVNPPAARVCGGCGAPLVERPDPPPGLPAAPDADGPVVPRLAADADADWTLSLRIDALPPPAPWPGVAVVSTAKDAAPAWPVLADAQAPWPAPAPPPAPPAVSAQARRTAKAERRASVRRARLRVGDAGHPVDPAAREVLLLEPDTTSRMAMSRILEAFGFRPHLAVSVAEAEGLSLRRAYGAVFLGLGSDVNGAARLCRRLRGEPRGRRLAIVAVGAADRHSDRVHMQLAGVDTMLFRPVGRGDLARVFDACGLPLPKDPRRGAPPDP